jgi:multiple sugar transport system permease protein
LATAAQWAGDATSSNWLSRTLDNRRVLIFLFMVPAAGLLLLFLTYPLGLCIWLEITDTRICSAVYINFLWNN